MNTGKVLATIPVGTFPQEMAISKATSKLFVTCMEDATSVPGMKGSVYAIDYNTYETTKIEGDFYQPHGIAVDDKHKAIYIVSTNSDPAGPPPHHATACNGRAGWYSVYDVYTLMPLSYARFQLSTLPYSAGARFH
jgi:DNA-binding beta-propeller fold protein YncE